MRELFHHEGTRNTQEKITVVTNQAGSGSRRQRTGFFFAEHAELFLIHQMLSCLRIQRIILPVAESIYDRSIFEQQARDAALHLRTTQNARKILQLRYKSPRISTHFKARHPELSSAWADAWYQSVFEILFHMGDASFEPLDEFVDYDPNAERGAILLLIRLAAAGVRREKTLRDVAWALRKLRCPPLETVLELLPEARPWPDVLIASLINLYISHRSEGVAWDMLDIGKCLVKYSVDLPFPPEFQLDLEKWAVSADQLHPAAATEAIQSYVERNSVEEEFVSLEIALRATGILRHLQPLEMKWERKLDWLLGFASEPNEEQILRDIAKL